MSDEGGGSSSSDSILRKIEGLDHDSRQVLKYFVQNRSVGELLAVRELRGLYRIKDPLKVISGLIELGLLERGVGCYNIPTEVVKAIKHQAEGR